MKTSLFESLFLTVIIVFAGCGRNHQESSGYYIKAALDSLNKLDSCVLSVRSGNHNLAMLYAANARKLAAKTGNTEPFILSLLITGNAHSLADKDSAYFCYSRALSLADSSGITSYNHKLLYNIGMLYEDVGDYRNALIFIDSSRSWNRRNFDEYPEAVYLNALGNIYRDIYDTVHARQMYDSSYRISQTHHFYDLMGTTIGNLARFIENPDSAKKQMKKASAYYEKTTKSQEEKSILLTNLSVYYNITPDSGIYFNKLALINISSDASPQTYISIYNNLAYDYLYMGKIDEAEKCLTDHAIPVCLKNNQFEQLSNVYDSYADILVAKGNFKKAFEYERQSNNALQNYFLQTGSAQVRLLAAMLNEKKKEAQLAESRLLISKTEASKDHIIIASICGALLLIILSFFIIQRKRIQTQRLQLSSAKKIMEAEETERTKLGQEFHDVAGQKFSQVMAYHREINYPDGESKEVSLKMIGDLKETVRNMSHRMNPDWILNFEIDESVEGLIMDVRKNLKADIETQINTLPGIAGDIKIQTFRIVQELLSNYLKYADGSKAIFHLYTDEKYLQLLYEDDGPGFDIHKIKKEGIGISGICQRVQFLNGKINLQSAPGSGTLYEIKIPLK